MSSAAATIHPYVIFFLSRYTPKTSEQTHLHRFVLERSESLHLVALSILESNPKSFGSLKDRLTPFKVLELAIQMNESLATMECIDLPIDELTFQKTKSALWTNEEIEQGAPAHIAEQLASAEKSSSIRAKFFSVMRRNPADLTIVFPSSERPPIPHAYNPFSAMLHQIVSGYKGEK